VFGRARRRDATSPAYDVTTVDGLPVLVVRLGTAVTHQHRVGDLILIRRVRDLELSDDRWLFSFRPRGVIELQGKPGAKLATRLMRLRPDVTVQVHHPDDD
jgi:hypothetical protein